MIIDNILLDTTTTNKQHSFTTKKKECVFFVVAFILCGIWSLLVQQKQEEDSLIVTVASNNNNNNFVANNNKDFIIPYNSHDIIWTPQVLAATYNYGGGSSTSEFGKVAVINHNQDDGHHHQNLISTFPITSLLSSFIKDHGIVFEIGILMICQTISIPIITKTIASISVRRLPIRFVRVLSINRYLRALDNTRLWKLMLATYSKTSASKIVNRSKRIIKLFIHNHHHDNEDDVVKTH